MKSPHRVASVAVAAAIAAGCDSPYQRQGILSDEVKTRLQSIEQGDPAAFGEAGPLPSASIEAPSPEELARLEPGQRVLMVEDIVTTGLSSRECIQAIKDAGGDVVAAACIVDRSGGKADVGVPLIALASLEVPAYPADALPPELAAIPIEDPGSRRLKG